MQDPKKQKKSARQADVAVQRQQLIQATQDAGDHQAPARGAHAKTKAKAKAKAAPGPGHAEPAPPLPSQTLVKPGVQADMQLQPVSLARGYRGSGKLEGKVAIITGGIQASVGP